MPGIFIHPPGSCDWDKEGEEPILTVPGAYWLCHKRNVYKFILKFHKSIRNTREFPYSRDLMKVIRRVLKSIPSQGQLFCTRNLLVEFNQGIWSRPSKVFAMGRFKERNAVAYHQPFVLTIQINNTESSMTSRFADDCRLSECTEVALRRNKRQSNSDSERRSVINVETVCSTSESYTNKTPSKVKDIETTTSILDTNHSTAEKSEEKQLENSCKMIEPTIKEEHRSINTHDPCTAVLASAETSDSSSFRDNNNSTELTKCSPVKDMSPSESLKVPSLATEDTIKNTDVEEVKVDSMEKMDVEDEIEVSDKMDVDKFDCTETDESSELNDDEKPICDRDHSISDKDSDDEVQIDSTCLPYQYLIEKDIENSRIKCIQKNRCETSSTSVVNATSTDVVDQTVEMQCLDMTDLVMKGLMFTLRQEEDSVKIVKQTTQDVLDEVLANSEKVRTKEGETCLVNSSLLKLESMISNIDNQSHSDSNLNKFYESLSRLITDKEKNGAKSCVDDVDVISEVPFGESSNNRPNNVIVSPTDAIKDEATALINIEEPEEIIPEVLQRNLMEVEKPEEYEGLLMDDFEETVMWKTIVNKDEDEKKVEDNVALLDDKNDDIDKSEERRESSNNVDGCQRDSFNRNNDCNSFSGIVTKCKIKGLKVISNKIVSSDLTKSLLDMLSQHKNLQNGANLSTLQNKDKSLITEEKDYNLNSDIELNSFSDVKSDFKLENSSVVLTDIGNDVIIGEQLRVNDDEFSIVERKSVPIICKNHDLHDKSRTSNEQVEINNRKDDNCMEVIDVITNKCHMKKKKLHTASSSSERRYPRREYKDTSQPVYVFKRRKRSRLSSALDEQRDSKKRKIVSNATAGKVNLYKLVDDLTAGAKVLVERLDLQNLRS